MDTKQLETAVVELQNEVKSLKAQLAELTKPRDRGPKSENSMTDEHAFRCKYGDLKDTKHKDVAEKLGLSYGQVFSCRGGYTFKHVKADWKKPEVKVETETKPETETQPA